MTLKVTMKLLKDDIMKLSFNKYIEVQPDTVHYDIECIKEKGW